MRRLLALLLLLAPAVAFAQSQQFNLRATIDISSSGANTVIAGAAGKRIAVYGIDLVPTTSTTVQLKSGSTALTGPMTLAAPYVKGLLQTGPAYWVTNAGDALVITLGGAVQTGGTVWYSQQ